MTITKKNLRKNKTCVTLRTDIKAILKIALAFGFDVDVNGYRGTPCGNTQVLRKLIPP